MAWNKSKMIKQTTLFFLFVALAMIGYIILFSGQWMSLLGLIAIWFVVVAQMATWRYFSIKYWIIQLFAFGLVGTLFSEPIDWEAMYFIGVLILGLFLCPSSWFT